MTQNIKNNLDRAKIAIIGPSFFGYLETLQSGLNARGIEAKFFDERWSNTVTDKIKLRFLPQVFSQKRADEHHRKIAADLRDFRATHVLVISSELFPVALLKQFQSEGMQVIAYSFDSFANKPHMQKVTEVAHAAASFDPDDCATFGLDYIPLYSNLPAQKTQKTLPDRSIDFLYFGTLHSNRAYWISRVKACCEKRNWSYRLFLYFHNRGLWYLRFALSPSVWPLGSLLSTTSFPSDVLDAASLDAKVIIDVHHPSQSGLTMRVFEALSGGSVVISTNPNVKTMLPASLMMDRVYHITPHTLEQVMQEALTSVPSRLTSDEVYYLSSARYIDQICDLMGCKHPR